ncbi:MAG: hypothetical protein GY950_14970 [bacterium]|nr:hypothetical protein [bacterium]
MKQKMFDKKLSLNKKTIANLGNGEMKEVNGGIDDTTWLISLRYPNNHSCECFGTTPVVDC